MAKTPSLSVLIPTLYKRRDMRRELFRSLEAQAGADGRVEILSLEDRGETPSGAKRNILLQSARGEYVAFVDDDDVVSPDYVGVLLSAIHHGQCQERRDSLTCSITCAQPDVITFDLERTARGKATRRMEFRTYHKDHVGLPGGLIGMAANHLCAWRRSVARRVGFVPWLGYNDDVFWYTPLLASGLAKYEMHIPEVLYQYRWNNQTTANQSGTAVAFTHHGASGGINAYRWGSDIVLDAMGLDHSVRHLTASCLPNDRPMRRVLDCRGCERVAPVRDLVRFCTVRSR